MATIVSNEVFQLGQFKAQAISFNATGAADTINTAELTANGGVHGLAFENIKAIFHGGAYNVAPYVHYTLGLNGKPDAVIVTSSFAGAISLLIIGE